MNYFSFKYLRNIGIFFLIPYISLFFSESVLGQDLIQNNIVSAEDETEYIWYHQEHPMEQSTALNSIFFLDENTGWAVGREGETGIIFNTSDGGDTWNVQLMFDEYSVNRFKSVHFVDEDHGWVVGRRNNNLGLILYTNDGGNTWADLSTDDQHMFSVFFTDQLNGWIICYSGGQNSSLLRTQDGGQTWSSIPFSGLGWLQLTEVHFTDSETGWAGGYVVGEGGIILHTSDGGESWTTQADNLERDLRSIYFVDSNNGWAVGDGGRIYHTDNGGLNWQNQANQELTTTSLRSVSFADTNTGWAVGGSSMYTFLRTDDGGDNWYVYETGWTMEPYSVFFIDHETGWVAGSGSTNIMHYTQKIYPGVPELTSPADQATDVNPYPVTFEWQSSDDADFYQFQLSRSSDFSSGTESVDDITVTQYTRDSDLFHHTEYFWRVRAKNSMAESEWSDAFTFTSGDGTSTSIESNGIPEEFTLSQNYPNPFNPSTVIRYEIPVNSEVKLEVFNLFGQRVATLVNDHVTAGAHEVIFDGSNLASGVYIYRLATGDFMKTQKLTLIK